MGPSNTHLNNLILGVCHLCDRTRELARSESTDTVALMPVREALQMVSTTLDALGTTWEDAVPATVPGDASPDDSHADWLLDGDWERGEP